METLIQITGLQYACEGTDVAIVASDYEKSKDFYVNKLGFQVIREEYRPVQDDMKLEVQIANCMIEIFGKKNPQPNAAARMAAARIRAIFSFSACKSSRTTTA